VHATDASSSLPDSVDALDSEEMTPQVVLAAEVVPTVEVVPDSMEMVHESVETLCAHCGTFHVGDVFREAFFQARRRARRCGCCGLLHKDYDHAARWFHDMERFDCEIYIPDVEKLEMNGNTIILPHQVVKRLEEHIVNMKDTKIHKLSCINKVHHLSNLHLLICRETSNCFG